MSAMFFFLAGMTVGGAVGAMALRNPVHCALCLVVTFAGLAGIYLGLGAQFLGLAQVLVYVGAVAILLVFVLLLTRSGDAEARPICRDGWGWGLGVGGAVMGVLLLAVWKLPGLPVRETPPELPTVKDLGEALMTEFVLPLQVVGVLLTAAMLGAAIVALRQRPAGSRPGEGQG
jgi:NADH-quinone oxidoreductase subunit J